VGVMRKVAKRVFFALPEPVQPVVRYYLDRQYHRIARITKNVVAAGPFKGMRYIHRSIESSICPKLLGTYEKELWPIVEQVIASHYRTVVNIGAAEGYYAVGFARHLPVARVICFETQVSQHHLLRRLAALNGVAEKLSLHGDCSPELLNETLNSIEPSFVICDIDGAEYGLLDPEASPALRQSDLLVEVHDFDRPDTSAVIRRRFEPTHTITVITDRPRIPADWPLPLKLDWEEQATCMAEGRPGRQQWFWMVAKQPSGGEPAIVDTPPNQDE